MRGSSEATPVLLQTRSGIADTVVEELKKISMTSNIVVEFGLDSNAGIGRSASVLLYNRSKTVVTLYKCPPSEDFFEALISAVKEGLIYPLTSRKAWLLSVAKRGKAVSIMTGLLQALVLVLIILRLPESLFLALILIALLMLLSVVESLLEVLRDSHLEKSLARLTTIHEALWSLNPLYKRYIDALFELLKGASAHACTIRGVKGKDRKGLVYIGISLFSFKVKSNRIVYSRIH